jgi:hypothetical protein
MGFLKISISCYFSILSTSTQTSNGLPTSLFSHPFLNVLYFDHLAEQEMTEQFTLVTEFSRHFYAMLNRDGVHAPLPNTAAAEKVIKIVGRLREYGENLSRKKKNLLAQDRDNSGDDGYILSLLSTA